MNDRCVICGEEIPEGGMICPSCRSKAEELPPETREMIAREEEKLRAVAQLAVAQLSEAVKNAARVIAEWCDFIMRSPFGISLLDFSEREKRAKNHTRRWAMRGRQKKDH